MKKFMLLSVAVLVVTTVAFTAHAANMRNEIATKSAASELQQVYQNDTMEVVSKANSDLTLAGLKKLNIAEYNLPAKNFEVYKAENISFEKNATIVLTDSDKGFSLIKGSIVRINSIPSKAHNEAYVFSVGYLKNDQHTSTSYGKMENGTVTAFEILNDKDSGYYKFYITQDSPTTATETFDIIITIENP